MKSCQHINSLCLETKKIYSEMRQFGKPRIITNKKSPVTLFGFNVDQL